jgi:formate hydrogenlyase subunit 3/multisubunit Na+/H+ antiporter MnhD subunit
LGIVSRQLLRGKRLAGAILAHCLSLLSIALSVGVWIWISSVVHNLYSLGEWDYRFPLCFQLARFQGAMAFVSILIAVLAILREPRRVWAIVALIFGFLLALGSAMLRGGFTPLLF